MGTIYHDAIIVTTYNAIASEYCAPGERQHLDAAIAKAREIGLSVIGPDPVETNGTQTFCICPDGSKEGWGTSNEGDRMREEFIDWLGNQPSIDWVAIRYGEHHPVVTASNHDGRL